MWIKWISCWSRVQYRWNHSLFLTCWRFFSPQWQSRHRAWLWFPGELCVAGDNQRDRGEVGLPLQPWKPWHILWGTATVDSRLCKRFVDCVQSHCSVFDWVVSPPLCFLSSVTVRVWSLCGSLNVSAARRPAWRDWEYTPLIPASTTNGTCLSTFNYGAFYLMISTLHTIASIYYTMCSAPPRRLFCIHFTPWLSSCVEVRYVPRFSLLSLYLSHNTCNITHLFRRRWFGNVSFIPVIKQHQVSPLSVRQHFTLPLSVLAQNTYNYFHICNGGTATARRWSEKLIGWGFLFSCAGSSVL